MSDLRDAMDFEAGRVWMRLRASLDVNYSTWEETITDVLLVDTHLADRQHFLMDKFSRHRESKCGADWEAYVFFRPDQFLHVWVQAKRMSPRGAFEYVRQEQIDLLISRATDAGAIPLVALYCLTMGDANVRHCECGRGASQQDYGCALVDARMFADRLTASRNLRRRLTLYDLSDRCSPWRCLACTGPSAIGSRLGSLYPRSVGAWPSDADNVLRALMEDRRLAASPSGDRAGQTNLYGSEDIVHEANRIVRPARRLVINPP